MKRYLVQLTALSLLALATGCQKEEGEINNPQNNQSAAVNISIDGLSIDAASSRAVIVDMPDFSKNGFKIAGYYTEGIVPVDPNPGKSGRFDDNLDIATPNVFDHNVPGGESVIVPELKYGKYHVTLSQWELAAESYLSYFAWASNVETGVAENTDTNPIKNSTKHGYPGAPFIWVTSGSTSASLNVDVVAAKSTDNSNDVVRSAIDLDFKHVMTKLKFRVKNSSSVDMTLTGARILFEATKVSRNAKYSFDGSTLHVGTWGVYADTEAAAYPVTLTNTNLVSNATAVPLDELLIIPQALAAGAISVELTYTIPNGTGTSTYIRTAPLKARTVEQNTSYTYEIALNETTISINEGRIGAWIDTSTGDLPYIAGVRDPNVLLLLDAYDAPYTHTDGNKYWLDRSGWNRHCKMVGSGVSYDATNKCYNFNGGGSFSVPALGDQAELTAEFIAKHPDAATTGNALLFQFGNSANISGADGRFFYLYLGYPEGSVRWLYNDTTNGGLSTIPGQGRLAYNGVPDEGYADFAMYSFARGGKYHHFAYNDLFKYNERSIATTDLKVGNLSVCQIGTQFVGSLKYVKILTKATTEINKAELATLKKRHTLKAPTEYIKDGLSLDLRGTDPPVNGNTWTDRSRSANHAKGSGIQYSADRKAYIFNGGNSLTLTNKANFTGNAFTVEIVLKTNGASQGAPVYHASPGVGITNRFALYYPYTSEGKIYFEPPFGDSGSGTLNPERISIPMNDIAVAQLNQVCGTKDMISGAKFYHNYNQHSYSNSYSKLRAIPTDMSIQIGQFSGEICAFRMYSRVLSDFERAWNYQVDKAKYNLP